MSDFQIVLFIIGVLFIVAILIHGLLTIRKQAEPKASSNQRIEPKAEQVENLPDEGVIGEVKVTKLKKAEPVVAAEPEKKPVQDLPPDVFIFHIAMPEGLTINGASLMQNMLTYGLKFCDENRIFERRQDASGRGEVIFRLVNSFNPGTFDIDNMEQFSTAGVSLFMTLPLPADVDVMQSFNMMHQAAKKLADEYGAEILDDNRQPLTTDKVRGYVEKARYYNQARG